MATVEELIRAGKVRLRTSGDVAVGTSATRLLVSNPMRAMVVITNSEANAARVGRTGGVTTTSGTPLAGSGGALVYTREYLGRAIGGEFWAVLETASGNLYVEEYEATEGA